MTDIPVYLSSDELGPHEIGRLTDDHPDTLAMLLRAAADLQERELPARDPVVNVSGEIGAREVTVDGHVLRGVEAVSVVDEIDSVQRVTVTMLTTRAAVDSPN
ncbi:hypothetical protein [Actinopolyspora halophila]|uniref:hypothetical protein n=1 Tax=Actinopolyspora halophila TaxID=1850 RepID=UPI000362531A|nr:hypothetical protein [Actinopolyspora halophila]